MSPHFNSDLKWPETHQGSTNFFGSKKTSEPTAPLCRTLRMQCLVWKGHARCSALKQRTKRAVDSGVHPTLFAGGCTEPSHLSIRVLYVRAGCPPCKRYSSPNYHVHNAAVHGTSLPELETHQFHLLYG